MECSSVMSVGYSEYAVEFPFRCILGLVVNGGSKRAYLLQKSGGRGLKRWCAVLPGGKGGVQGLGRSVSSGPALGRGPLRLGGAAGIVGVGGRSSRVPVGPVFRSLSPG